MGFPSSERIWLAEGLALWLSGGAYVGEVNAGVEYALDRENQEGDRSFLDRNEDALRWPDSARPTVRMEGSTLVVREGYLQAYVHCYFLVRALSEDPRTKDRFAAWVNSGASGAVDSDELARIVGLTKYELAELCEETVARCAAADAVKRRVVVHLTGAERPQGARTIAYRGRMAESPFDVALLGSSPLDAQGTAALDRTRGVPLVPGKMGVAVGMGDLILFRDDLELKVSEPLDVAFEVPRGATGKITGRLEGDADANTVVFAVGEGVLARIAGGPEFELDRVPPGTYRVVARRGEDTSSVEVTVEAGKTSDPIVVRLP
jgi:hypothetical protein